MPAPVWVEETTSTQDAVRSWAAAQRPAGVSLVAERQTEGRGRLGRVWSSPEGAVQISILLRPQIPVARLPLVSLAAAVGAWQATRSRLRIKWPNDLLTPDGRKVAGILAEADVSDQRVRSVVVGIGVNVAAVPQGLPDVACLEDVGPPVSREELAVDLVAMVRGWVDQLRADPDRVLDAWRRNSCTLGQRVRVGEREGLAEDVADDGALLLRLDSGARARIVAGDVLPLTPGRSEP